MDEHDEGTTPTPAPTVGGTLRARREQGRAALVKDFRVPTIPGVGVRFKPVDPKRLEQSTKAAEKSKNPDRNVIANAGILAESCVGVYEVIDGEKVSVDPDDRDGTWPRFDERLAQLLEMEHPGKASDVVRELYGSDPHVVAIGGKLAEWSYLVDEDLENDFQGN